MKFKNKKTGKMYESIDEILSKLDCKSIGGECDFSCKLYVPGYEFNCVNYAKKHQVEVLKKLGFEIVPDNDESIRKNGEWRNFHYVSGNDVERTCSECKNVVKTTWFQIMNYCPVCGSKNI